MDSLDSTDAVATRAGRSAVPTATPGAATGAAPALRGRALRSSAWAFSGHAAGQILRFVNNLGLTYLIAPELIGLMGTVHVFLAGLQLMSDFGIGPALIQSQRGEERVFQDTAWTLHVGRGAAIWLLTVALGPVLAAVYAGQPGAESLTWLVPTVGLTALIGGFHSTAVYMRNRHLDLRAVVLLDVGAQLLGCTVGLLWCYLSPSLWGLVVGVLVHQSIYTTFSWRLGPRNRPCWDRDAVRAVARFGRWIWLSTMLTWVAMQVDRIVLPTLLRFDGMAVYQVAMMIAVAVPEMVHVLGSRVLFPTLADLVRRREHERLARLWRMRLPILVPGVGALLVLSLFGDVLVHALYPTAFDDAGWMLRLLAAAAIPQAVTASSWYAFFALGRSAVPMCLQAAKLVLKCLAMVWGYRLGDLRGLILGLLVAEVAHYPLVAWALRRHGLLQLRLDLPVLLGAGAIVALGLWLR